MLAHIFLLPFPNPVFGLSLHFPTLSITDVWAVQGQRCLQCGPYLSVFLSALRMVTLVENEKTGAPCASVTKEGPNTVL